MYSLCIVESPAKCGKIQGFLGPGWKVVATMGHIRALEEDLSALGIERDFQPRYTFLKEKGRAMSGIREAAASASTIYLAADDDREGEAIAYSVAVLLGLDPLKTPRAVFHEITKEAITHAVSHPRRLDMNRVEAQQARAVLDMMVGFTISPILWKCVGPSLSAGRCQTPALRLLVDRETEITNFSAATSWRISGEWTADATLCNASLCCASLCDELEDEESAMNFLENIHADRRGVILSTKTVPRSAAPPKPLMTSTLQQEASAIFSYQPKSIMKSAQKLYEGGHITYMRTDSIVMSEEARRDACAFVETSFGKMYVGLSGGSASLTASSKGHVKAQEAHEAIRPTHMDISELPVSGDYTSQDARIYKLIWQRAIQSVMAPATSEEHIILFKALADPGEFVLQTVWKRSLFPGWKKVTLAAVNLDEDDDPTASVDASEVSEAKWAAALKLKQGDTLMWKTLAAHPHVTRPLGRYTEATLVRELERRGIGRPSTFASLVGTVLDKEYAKKEDRPAREIDCISFHLDSSRKPLWPPTRQIEKKKVGAEKQKLSPTPLGTSVLEFCVREFPQLFDYGFTKRMEDRLDLIASGDEPWKAVCRDTWASYKDTYEELKKNGKRPPRPVGEKGPAKDPEEAIGELEGHPIIKKKGPYGLYLQWGTTRVPYVENESAEALQSRVKAKSESLIHTLGPYEFRKGAYGVYMMKGSGKGGKGKKPIFVPIPDALDPKVLTEEAAARIYKTGLTRKRL
jgi:DNA topoisomerase-1